MKKAFFIFFFIVQALSLHAQVNTEIINQQFDYLCSQRLFTDASNFLVEKGNECLRRGDTLSAYELQMKNCLFTDEHLDEFFQFGLTWEGYFSNWYITISLAAWLHMENEISPELIRILGMVSEKEPSLLPFYSSTLGYVLYKYKEEGNENPTYILQKALDYIKSVEPTPELVRQFVKITSVFYNNRFYNSFDYSTMIVDRFDEIVKWYNNNHQYIIELNTIKYQQDVIEYELLFVDEMMLYATEYQLTNSNKAVSVYEECILVLSPFEGFNDKVTQKIASCYASIADIYLDFGDKLLCKEYCDLAFLSLFNHKDDIDYCNILNSLSLSYFIAVH